MHAAKPLDSAAVLLAVSFIAVAAFRGTCSSSVGAYHIIRGNLGNRHPTLTYVSLLFSRTLPTTLFSSARGSGGEGRRRSRLNAAGKATEGEGMWCVYVADEVGRIWWASYSTVTTKWRGDGVDH